MSRTRATLTGFVAILLWSSLALLTVRTAPVPPFLLNALTFAVGGAAGLVWIAAAGTAGRLREVPFGVYVFGTGALFLYHALYFFAFRLAPAAETGLIAYLWPLLIVLFSGLLPGERLRAGHLAGAALAFAGVAVILAGSASGSASGAASSGGTPAGFALAFLCALTWAGYSVLSRRLGAIPTEAVAVFCLATSALSVLAHLVFERTLWPADAAGWAATLALGLGPVGLAFYVWDIGVKRGDIQVLGTASYAAPVLSTLALVAAGTSEPSARLALAAALVTGGAALAGRASARAAAQAAAAVNARPTASGAESRP
jgi:drug/metabolite transporter (DMT)-like permease